MGSAGDAYDNAMCESFFATLECELLARHRFKSQPEARIAVFAFIEGFYNPRPRSDICPRSSTSAGSLPISIRVLDRVLAEACAARSAPRQADDLRHA